MYKLFLVHNFRNPLCKNITKYFHYCETFMKHRTLHQSIDTLMFQLMKDLVSTYNYRFIEIRMLLHKWFEPNVQYIQYYLPKTFPFELFTHTNGNCCSLNHESRGTEDYLWVLQVVKPNVGTGFALLPSGTPEKTFEQAFIIKIIQYFLILFCLLHMFDI